MNKYNNKQEEERANKVLGVMMILFCIIIILDHTI
jgi:hypothetical protein|tara:strand:- start:157 stop:261 length:105 start_codon:yes stop_codon:yes gene_type:complete